MSDLTEIRGIANSVEAQLQEIGIENINQLASTDLEYLEENDIRNAEKILKRAKMRGVMVESGDEVQEEQEAQDSVSTGMEKFDEVLEGGYPEGFVIGVSGEPKAGKTQLIFNSLVSAVEDTGNPAIYIETEPNRFQSSRLRAICNDEDTFSKIYRIKAHSLEQQMIAYSAVKDNFDEVSLVAIDSFVANFRLSDEFEGRGDLKKRSNLISRHLKAIQSMASEMECPVLMSLQVYGNPKSFDNSVPIWGGSLMHHTITCLIHMTHGKGQLREAQLKGHPAIGDKEVTMKIGESGMEAL